MTRDLRKLVVRLLVVVLIPLVFGLGCSAATGPKVGTEGGDPAAPPSPPAELPNLRFPATVSDISVGALVNPGTALLSALAIGDDISNMIEDNAITTAFVYDATDEILAPLHQLVIPISQKNDFEDLIVQGSELISVKINFSDFGGRGCSGNTAALPICFRIWYNDERTFFGQFDAVATETNAGAGELIGSATTRLIGRPNVNLRYDLRDPQTKSVDLAIGMEAIELRVRIMLDQVPSGDSFQKTFRASGVSKYADFKEDISRWIDNQDYWSGTRNEEFSAFNFDNACAALSTGRVVDRDICKGRGIDVEGLDPAPLPDVREFEFPDLRDFPLEPTF